MTVTTLPYGYLERDYLVEESGYIGEGARGAMAMEALFQRVQATGMQILFTIYNTTNVRILCDFPSRGNAARLGEPTNNAWGFLVGTGQNIKANTTQPGDFSPLNMNTDVVEEVWRSADTVRTNIRIDIDTEREQGVFMDTFSLQNTNLTRSAIVRVIGSNVSNFSVVDFDQTLVVIDDPNLYWIAPDLPATGQRYWRILIDDLTNPDGFVSIGAVLFGVSKILQGECMVDQISFTEKDFADTVETEGFTNVANSRALKKQLGLEFRSLDSTQLENFSKLKSIFRESRTTLKCLWIPTPNSGSNVPAVTEMSRFAVFSKLVQVPSEAHNSKGATANYVSFNIELDESR